MSTDTANTDEMKGRAKEAVGSLTGDEDLENEGKLDQVVGDVKETVDRVAARVKNALGRNK